MDNVTNLSPTERKDALHAIRDQLSTLGAALRGAETLLADVADDDVSAAQAVVKLVRNELERVVRCGRRTRRMTRLKGRIAPGYSARAPLLCIFTFQCITI